MASDAAVDLAPARLVGGADWWRQAAVYQIYPRSFADADADGIGDIPGITSRVGYLSDLGVDAVWLSPFYPSALADGGYDVDDYRDVDPRLGTLADFDALVTALHGAGIRIVVDIVPNHTSNRHAWFQEAIASPKGSAARDRYIFRDGRGEGGAEPPTDWDSVFGGSAWTRVPDGQWYLHFFAEEQPDLNWQNSDVREDFLRTLRFWADRGVDGFRIDVAHMLAKDLGDPLPSQAELDTWAEVGTHPVHDRDEVHEIYAEWRAVFNEYDPPRTAVAEAWVERSRRPRYASAEGLGQAFNFDLLQAGFDASQFRHIVTDNLELAEESGSSSTWVLSNHDVVRHATRYGLPDVARDAEGRPTERHGGDWLLSGGMTPVLDRALGTGRARAATLFMLALPGSAYLYQGEELGLHEVVELDDAVRQDPTYFRSLGADVGRDGCRVPLPWESGGSSFGFGDDGAHLPQPAWFGDLAVDRQDEDPASTLSLYRRALALREELLAAEELEWVDSGRDDVLWFRRPGGWEVVTNFGSEPFALDDSNAVLASSATEPGVLPGATTVWLHRRP
jgi:alpha-glucosidase